MALAETQTANQSEKPQANESTKHDRKEKPLMKVVIRRLPPTITEEDFLHQVAPVPQHDYMYIVNGEASLGENSFSRAYINFTSSSDVYVFKEKFDNYVFVNDKGHEYPAVVEYASFQKVPKKRKAKADPKVGTVESDPCYLEFLEALKEEPNLDKPEYSFQPTADTKTVEGTTPLLDFLKQRKIDRMRIREERRKERHKKEIEIKKVREEERKKRLEEKAAKKSVLKDSETKEDSKDEKPPEKTISFTKNRKYEDKKVSKPKYTREEKKEFKNKNKYEDSKKQETKEFPKKVKKYSEKREERKIEATKAENREREFSSSGGSTVQVPEVKEEETVQVKSSEAKEDAESQNKNKENDPRARKRIRNKDRPSLTIYKPGMLRKKSVDTDKDIKVTDKQEKASTSEAQE